MNSRRRVASNKSTVFRLANDGNWYSISGFSWRALKASRILAKTYEKIPLEPGGMIVLSTDINALAGPGLTNKLKAWVKSQAQRYLTRNKKVRETIEKQVQEEGIEDIGWTLGNIWNGRYSTKIDGEPVTFNEKSFAIDMSGVDYSFVEKVAEKLLDKFEQEAVLLVNNKTGARELLQQDTSGVSKTAAASEGYWIDARSGKKFDVSESYHSKWIQKEENAKKVGLPEGTFQEIKEMDPSKEDDEIRKRVLKDTKLIRMRQHGTAMSFEFSATKADNYLWVIKEFLDKNAGPFTNLYIANILPAGVRAFQGNARQFIKELEEEDSGSLSKVAHCRSEKIAAQLIDYSFEQNKRDDNEQRRILD